MQAVHDSDGGAAEADEGQYHGESRCNTLQEHRRQSTVPSTHEVGITFAMGYVSRFMEDPREDHWVAVKRLLRSVFA